MEQKEIVEHNFKKKYDNQNYWKFKKQQQEKKQQQFKFNVIIPPILQRDTNYPNTKDKYI
jgi:hypothetical protein